MTTLAMIIVCVGLVACVVVSVLMGKEPLGGG